MTDKPRPPARVRKEPGTKKIVLDYELIEKLASSGLTQTQISRSIGMGEQYLTHRKKEDQKLCDALEIGAAKGIAVITNALFQKAQSGDLGAMIFYLKNRAGWKDKIDVDADVSHSFYMEGRPETNDVDQWQQQYNPAPANTTPQ